MASSTRKIKPRIPDDKRIYAVGDVHGRADLLAPLLGRIDQDLAIHPVAQALQIFLGDYIDRGPDSRAVLDLLIGRKRRYEMLYLRGNHEAYARAALDDFSILPEWMRMGGAQTFLSYGLRPPERADAKSLEDAAYAFRQTMPDDHRHFIENLALSFSCGDFFFAHAGVRPGILLEKQAEQDLLWIRNDFLLHEEDFGKVIVHGHTPAMAPDVRQNRINIDTGAYATGRLTCLVLEEDRMRFL